MAAVLRSHVLGAWHTPSDEGRPLFDAVTGAENIARRLAQRRAEGSDAPVAATVLDATREIGRASCRERVFRVV